MAPHYHHHLIIIFFITTTTISIIPPSIHATEFIFNNFTTTATQPNPNNKLLLYGSAKLQSSTLTLTNDSTFSIGRALYFSKIPTKLNNSNLLPFSSSFIFSITPYKNLLAGHGFAFIFTPSFGINGTSSSQHLGLYNLTNDGKFSNHVFAIEFDVFKNQEFNDLDNNHVGVDVNSLTSVVSNTAGFWSGDNAKFKSLKLNNGVNYQVWIDYYDMVINVTMAKVGQVRPNRPLISAVVNLQSVLLDEMYVGFTAATGQLVQSHRILSWAFSNTNFSIGDALVTTNLPTFVAASGGSIYKSKKFILGFTFGFLFFVVCLLALLVVFVRRKRRFRRRKEGVEEWEAEYWPHRISYDEIEVATKGFSEENVIGIGGNGKVYKGVLLGGSEVAVKIISYGNERGVREFLAEVSSLGRLKHRSLVGLIGWCKKDRGSLILVYDFLKNGSLDKRIFECDQTEVLSWEERLKILQDVAGAILYLHEGWDVKVLHRDIKSSNVLLDNDMNAKLGDFGLALMHQHEAIPGTTQVVGTVGYMAPEVIQTGRASTQTDVFGFGVLVLEVVSGRRPIENGKPGLVDWIWRLMERKELIVALDEKLKNKGGYSSEEVEKVLSLGLLCVYPNPQKRPAMRQVVKALDLNYAGGEAYLLDEARTRAMWSSYQQSFGAGRHPTFQEMHNTLPSSSVSLSASMLITEGR